jgi:hypothetical protein
MKRRLDAVVQLIEKFIKKRFQDATVTKEPAIQTRPVCAVKIKNGLGKIGLLSWRFSGCGG